MLLKACTKEEEKTLKEPRSNTNNGVGLAVNMQQSDLRYMNIGGFYLPNINFSDPVFTTRENKCAQYVEGSSYQDFENEKYSMSSTNNWLPARSLILL